MSDFEYLDKESEILLKSIIDENNVVNKNIGGQVIKNLIDNDYLTGVGTDTLSGMEPQFVLTGISHKGKTYFELKNNYEKSQKKLSRREWKIAIVSAIIGGLIGLIPSIINWIGGI